MIQVLALISTILSFFMSRENSNQLNDYTYHNISSWSQAKENLNPSDSTILERLQGKWKLESKENDEVWIKGNLWTIHGFLDHSTYNPYYNITMEHRSSNCGQSEKETAYILLIHNSEMQPNISYEILSLTDSSLDLRLCPDNSLRKFKKRK